MRPYPQNALHSQFRLPSPRDTFLSKGFLRNTDSQCLVLQHMRQPARAAPFPFLQAQTYPRAPQPCVRLPDLTDPAQLWSKPDLHCSSHRSAPDPLPAQHGFCRLPPARRQFRLRSALSSVRAVSQLRSLPGHLTPYAHPAAESVHQTQRPACGLSLYCPAVHGLRWRPRKYRFREKVRNEPAFCRVLFQSSRVYRRLR